MATLIGSLLRQAHRDTSKLNILCMPTHERYEVGIAKTGHTFYAWRGPGIKDWKDVYAPRPANYNLLNPALGAAQIPLDLDLDLVLSQNKFGQYQVARELSQKLHLPLVCLEHTLPMNEWGDRMAEFKQMKGNINVFISEYSQDKWGWKDEPAEVIHHGIETDVFCPGLYEEKQPHVLSVVNDFANRDVFCGYNLWRNVTGGLPVKLLGDNPGIGKPAPTVKALADAYRQCSVFLNTSLISPVPTALLEAMSCGCAVVSTDTCMIPEIIKDGYNGFICNNEKQMRERLELLLEDQDLALQLGTRARATIEARFTMDKFVENWKKVFQRAAETVYTGAY